MINPAILFREAAQRKCVEIAQSIVDEIQTSPATPRNTGRLAAGYHVREDGGDALIVTSVDYWDDVEYGHDVVNDSNQVTGHAEPQPHVRPAIEIERAKRR